jgi:hypothetical protein
MRIGRSGQGLMIPLALLEAFLLTSGNQFRYDAESSMYFTHKCSENELLSLEVTVLY